MFSIGWPEFTIVLIVGLMVIGPRDLPKALHSVGKWVGAARRMSRDFQRHVDDMVRDSELQDLRDGVNTLRRTTNVRSAIENTIDPDKSLRKSIADTANPTAIEAEPTPKAGPAEKPAAKAANPKAPSTKKPVAKKSVAKKPAARKRTAKPEAAISNVTVAKSSPAKTATPKTATPKKTATKPAAAKPATAKPATAKTSTAKPPTAKPRTAAKRTPKKATPPTTTTPGGQE